MQVNPLAPLTQDCLAIDQVTEYELDLAMLMYAILFSPAADD